jgi:hypothetical protein
VAASAKAVSLSSNFISMLKSRAIRD